MVLDIWTLYFYLAVSATQIFALICLPLHFRTRFICICISKLYFEVIISLSCCSLRFRSILFHPLPCKSGDFMQISCLFLKDVCPLTLFDPGDLRIKYIRIFIRWNSVQSSKSAKYVIKICATFGMLHIFFGLLFSENILVLVRYRMWKNWGHWCKIGRKNRGGGFCFKCC